MDTEMKQDIQEKGIDGFKLVKSPLFIAGIAALVLSVVFAIVGTVVNPFCPEVIKKYGEALQEQRVKILEDCYSPDVEKSEEELAMTIATYKMLLMSQEISEDAEIEILVGKPMEYDTDNEVKYIPTIMVIREDDDIEYITFSGHPVIEVDGKEYLYTGEE